MEMSDKFKLLIKGSYPRRRISGTNIPIFSPRTRKERKADKYDKDFYYVDRYTGLFAFSHLLLGQGGAEGLYRTIDQILLSRLKRSAELLILDVGCGVGRTIYDCADLFPNAMFIGLDYAYNMCLRAKDVLLEGKRISLQKSLAYTGFRGRLQLERTKKLKNVFLAQGDASDLPFKDDRFDCVINTYLIDRVKDPRRAIVEMIRVLKPGGLFVLSDPMSFEKKEAREQFAASSSLIKLIEDQEVKIDESFDGLIYREVMDVRGNYSDWQSFVCHGRKRVV